MGAHYKGSLLMTEANLPRQDRNSKVVVIKPRFLDVIWGNDERYWRGLKNPNADQTVELLQVCWLEVTGSYPMNQLQKGRYKVSFNVSTKPDAFGWSDSPVYLMVKTGDKYNWKKADLSQMKSNDPTVIPYTSANKPLTFDVPDSTNENEKVTFGLYEIWRGRWKGGLVIYDVKIEPTT